MRCYVTRERDTRTKQPMIDIAKRYKWEYFNYILNDYQTKSLLIMN
jgi:hypothetical protein